VLEIIFSTILENFYTVKPQHNVTLSNVHGKLPNGTSLRPYHWNFAECDMILKCIFDLYTLQLEFDEFRKIVHGTISQWGSFKYPWDLN